MSDDGPSYDDGPIVYDPSYLDASLVTSTWSDNQNIMRTALTHYHQQGMPISFTRLSGEYDGHEWACCTYDMIMMTNFLDRERELVSFFHELGHIINTSVAIKSGRSTPLCRISNEGAAWETGLNLLSQFAGIVYPDQHPVMIWARSQIQTYCEQDD